MKKLVYAAAVWVGLSSTVIYAEEPSATVTELMNVMQMDAQMSAGFEAMLPVIESLSQQWQLNPEQKTELRQVYRDWFDNDLDRSMLKNKIALEYDKVFSESEMRDMISFYHTPTGEKVLRLMPELSKKGALLGMKEGQKKQHLLEQKVRAFYEANVQPSE